MILIYRTLIAPVGFLLLIVFSSFFSEKIRSLVQVRKSKKLKDLSIRNPIWIHCSSGEFEYAKPVIREIKKNNPNEKILVTYLSNSYVKAIESFPGVDQSFPLPFDLPGPIRQFLNHIKPKCLLIARTDLWPELLTQTKYKNIPSLLFSATFPSNSSFLARLWKKTVLDLVDHIYCVSFEDYDFAIKKLHLPTTQVSVLGDTRYDQVIDRLSSPRPLQEHLEPHGPTLVAGSTWSEDEKILLVALEPLLKQKKITLILVPHEPTPEHIASLQSQLDKMQILYGLYSTATTPMPVILVDQVGILADLYAWGHLAFVGGSFKRTVHSVMEPLTHGALTFVGPYFENNREAVEFQKINVTPKLTAVESCQNADDLQNKITITLSEINPDLQKKISDLVLSKTGASSKLAQILINKLL